MSRTLRRQHFNRNKRSYYRYLHSFVDVDKHYKEMLERGYHEKDCSYKFFSDVYSNSKGRVQLYKRISFKRLRQEFSIKERKLILGLYEDNELILERVKPNCIKYDID